MIEVGHAEPVPLRVRALTAVTLGLSLVIGCVIVAARLLSLLGLRTLVHAALGGIVLLAAVGLASLGRRDLLRLRVAAPTAPEWTLLALCLLAGWLIASRTFHLSLFAPTTFTVDSAHHAGLVNWMVARGRVPIGLQPELTTFSSYPLWGHVLPAIVSSATGLQPITTLWLMALASVVLQWPLTALICRAASRRRTWDYSAVPILVMILAWRFTIGLATWDFFFAQLVSLLMAVAGVAFMASAESVRAPIRRWAPAAAVFAGAALFTYPQQAAILPLAAFGALLTRRYARRPSRRAVSSTVAAACALLVLAVLLLRSQNYLTSQTLLGAGEGSATTFSMATVGGWLPVALVVLGAFVLAGDVRRHHAAGAVALAAAVAPAALGLALWAAQRGILVKLDVTNYRITKNIYSAIPFAAVLAGVAVGWAIDGRVPAKPRGHDRVRAKDGGVGIVLLATGLTVLAVASRPMARSGVAVPLVSRDATELADWAHDNLDVQDVGIAGPGLEPYTLWFAALLRPVPPDPPNLDASTAVALYLRGPAPASSPVTLASTRWSAWPQGPSTERYLLISGLPEVRAYLRRPGVSLLRQQGTAAILERSGAPEPPSPPIGADMGRPEQGVEGLP